MGHAGRIAGALAAIALGVLIGRTLAWILLVVALVLFLLEVASTQAAQRRLPALGRVPLVSNHGFRVVPASGPPAPQQSQALSETRRKTASQLRTLAHEVEGFLASRNEEAPVKGGIVAQIMARASMSVAERSRLEERVAEHNRKTGALYYLTYRPRAMDLLDQLRDLGVPVADVRATVEKPDKLGNVPTALRTPAYRVEAS